MKKTILSLAACAFIITGALTSSCTSSSQKVEDAQNSVNESNKELEAANEEYLMEVENYRKETAEKIAANERSIAEFNARIDNEKKEARAEYKNKITALDQKNSDLKKKMDEYKVEGKEQWELFKVEFNHDMDELGRAFNSLTVKNVK